MDLQLLQQVDRCLSKCGKPQLPQGYTALYIPRGIPIQITIGATTEQTFSRELAGDTEFELRAISMSVTSTVSCYFQAQLPDGTFLLNQEIDISQIAGYGSARYAFSKPLLCPPGTHFILTFDTSTPGAATTQPIMVLLEGCDRYMLRGGKPARCPEAFAASIKRIQGDGNENLLAPCWQQGYTPEPPQGFVYEPITYRSSPQGQAGNVRVTGLAPYVSIPLAGPFTATAVIQVDQSNDFLMRRLLFDVQADAGVTGGTILARIRAGSGYAFTDDYFDVQQYIGSAPIPKDWLVKAADQIFFDLQMVDSTGTGNMYIKIFAEGLRRIRKI